MMGKMTKLMMIAMMVSGASLAKAGVADFNALIDENLQAQRQLHHDVSTADEDTRAALNQKNDPIVVVDTEGAGSINVPTDKNFMRFKKETVNHASSAKDQQDRLANEFNSADLEF